ncbi:hypothetical protein ACJ73_05184 [Blastomyces percursus]|uniref:Uncharacterized protein n=1 Tax=Blastomyces percursus TaxID=1658174 RepID=A0A1J9R627_9EURO|nr:hypothetical protein ACJ73_05184 [Blastomyces percursus]
MPVQQSGSFEQLVPRHLRNSLDQDSGVSGRKGYIRSLLRRSKSAGDSREYRIQIFRWGLITPRWRCGSGVNLLVTGDTKIHGSGCCSPLYRRVIESGYGVVCIGFVSDQAGVLGSDNDPPEEPSEKRRKDDNQPLEVDSECCTDDRVLWEEILRSQREKEKKARKEGRRIRQSLVKCCYCEYIGVPDPRGKCLSCGCEVCGICFHFQDTPLPNKEETIPGTEPDDTVPDEDQDELWKNVREFLRHCKGETTTPNRRLSL